MIDLAAGAHIHGLSIRGHIGGLRCLGLVVEFVGGERAHDVNRSGQEDRLTVIQPGVVILRFSFEIAGALRKPCGIVSCRLRGFWEKTSQLPVGAHLLQHQRQRHGALAAVHVDNSYAVLAGRQIRQDKHRAILGLSRRPKYTAQKFGASQRRRAIGGQQKGRPHRCLSAGERGLVFFDCSFDAGKAVRDRSNGVLLQSGRIAACRHFEVALRGGFERSSRRSVHVRGALADLGWDVRRCSQQQQTQPAPAAPSSLERVSRSSNQGKRLRSHFTRSPGREYSKCLQS